MANSGSVSWPTPESRKSRRLSDFSVRMRKRFSRHFSCWNLIKKINLWTFDSRRDTKIKKNPKRSRLLLPEHPQVRPSQTQTLIDGTHDAAGELPFHREPPSQPPISPSSDDKFKLGMPWPSLSASGSMEPGTCNGCRMSCKLAQLIYFNTNLTLIGNAPQLSPTQPSSAQLSAHFISLHFTALHFQCVLHHS